MVDAVAAGDQSAIIDRYIASQQAAAAQGTSTASQEVQTSLSKVTGDFETFLKILTTQLKNQNPESATDVNQFTQQLVQFSGIEQQINTNAKLDQLLGVFKPNALTSLLSYVGKFVEAPTTDKIIVQNGETQFAYSLPAAGQSVSIQITDSDGQTVTTLAGPTQAGLNRVIWDGRDSLGNTVPDGAYKFTLVATSTNGEPMTITDKRMIGLVTSVQTESDGSTSLSLGNAKIKDADISAVFSTQLVGGGA